MNLLFYTTCPKCVKYYGKKYVVGFVERDTPEQQTTERISINLS